MKKYKYGTPRAKIIWVLCCLPMMASGSIILAIIFGTMLFLFVYGVFFEQMEDTDTDL